MKRTTRQAVNFSHIVAIVTCILSSAPMCWGAADAGGTIRAVQRQQHQRERRAEGIPMYRFDPRIVGGNKARNGRYPYAEISLATDAGLHQCGGSLIAPDIILTAGHCHGFFTQIRVDIYNIKNEFEKFQIFKAERMHFHPNFDELWFRYDFLLLQLNGTVDGLTPVRINSDQDVPETGDPLTVVGWGLTDPADTTAYPDELKEVTVHYLTNENCEQTSSKGQRLYQGYIFDEMMCAQEDGKDACSGDSGAPLIRRGSTPDQDVVVAVVSWGNGCATDYPGVYARISYQYQWIRDVVCAVSDAPPASFRCAGSLTSTIYQNDNNNNPPVVTPTLPTATLPAPAPVPAPTPATTAGALRPTLVPQQTTNIVTASAPEGHLPIVVEIQLDLRSKDTGWSLISSTGEVITKVEAGTYTTPYELVEQVVHLPKSSQFVFVMTDTQGDGICCEYGGGWYQVGVVLTDDTIKPLVKGYGTFALSSTNVFMTPADNFPILTLGIGSQSPPLQDVLPPPGSVLPNSTSKPGVPLTYPTNSQASSATAPATTGHALLTLMTTTVSLMICTFVIQ